MLALARYKVSGKAVPCSCVMDYAKGQEPVCTLPLIARIPTEEESSSFAIVFAVELVALGTTDRKMAAISSSSPYDGNRDNFAKFQAALETSMAFSRLSYLWNSAELARLVLAPPAIVFVEGGPANQRRYLNTMAMTAHNLATAECVKHARNIHVDFLQAIGILQGLCNDKILRDIEEFVNPALDRPSRAKFMAAWNYLVSTYGPVDQMDVDKIKAQLRSADPNTNGFIHLVSIHKECISNLSKVKKYGPGRVPLLDADGVHMDYSMSLDELRSILMDQLALTDRPAFSSLRADAVRNPFMDYPAIMVEIERLLKDAAIYDPRSVPRPALTTAFASHTYPPYQQQQEQSSYRSSCKNCHGDHSTWDCRDTRCHTCNIRFNSIDERKQHAQCVHSRNGNSSNSNDNRNNNNYRNYNNNSRSNNRDRSRSRGNDNSSRSRRNNNGDRSRSRSRTRDNSNYRQSSSDRYDRQPTPNHHRNGDRRSRPRALP
jgi:hypothetical protein